MYALSLELLFVSNIMSLLFGPRRVKTCLRRFCNHLDGKERAGCFALFVFLVSRDCSVDLSHDATSLSVVCDCGIS